MRAAFREKRFCVSLLFFFVFWLNSPSSAAVFVQIQYPGFEHSFIGVQFFTLCWTGVEVLCHQIPGAVIGEDLRFMRKVVRGTSPLLHSCEDFFLVDFPLYIFFSSSFVKYIEFCCCCVFPVKISTVDIFTFSAYFSLFNAYCSSSDMKCPQFLFPLVNIGGNDFYWEAAP